MEYENISLGESIEILEEVMELDDSIYAYNRKYRMALKFVIDCIKRDMAEPNGHISVKFIPVNDVKAEIKEKCDEINYIVSGLPYPKHRAIQELLCEILDNIGKAESEVKPNETDN